MYPSEYSYPRATTLCEYRYKFGPTARRPKTCTGHNRCVFTDAETGERCFVLHNTIIARKHADGTVTLDTGGWSSLTTRKAMAEALRELLGGNRYAFAAYGGGPHYENCIASFVNGKRREVDFDRGVHFDPATFKIIKRF